DGIYDTAWSSVAGASYTWNDDYNGNVVLQVNDSVGHLITGTAAVTVNNVNPTANANGNYSCYVGETVNLIGSATDLGNDTFTYNWDLDNDSIYETPGQNVGYLCTSTGIYQVNLNVADDDGGSDTDSATINATTTPLVALPGGPYIGYENSPVTFVGNAYGGVYPYQFRWDFDGNGTWDTSWDSSGIASYTWSSEYTGTVVMQVSDFLGNITSATTSVSIYRNLVVDANGPYTGIEGSAILFNGSASGGLQPYQYRWDFDNDGNYDTTWSSTVEASHPWDDDYNGVVVLQVNDSLGNTATNTSNVAINNSNPTANADGPYGCIIGENITLYGLATDPGNDIITYSWDLNNDGTYETNGQNAIFTCAANGTYPVSLRAEDEDGGIGIDTTYVTTSIPTLLIDADGPYSGAEGFAISFSGSATGGLQPYQFRWDFDNDGAWDTAWASTPDASYSYSDDYNGTAVLMINDSAGTTAIDTSSVSVSNIAPIAEANGPYTCNEWEIITLAGYATDQGSDTFTYIWDLGDDGNYETPGQNPVYTCGLTGVYTVNLKVTDDDGGYSSDTAMINVGSVSPPIPPPPENDTTPPTIIINSPKPITYFGADVLYDFSVSDDYWVDKIWYGIGAPGVSPGGYTYYTEPFNLTIVDNGTFTFILYVYANDTSGNIGSASVTYILNNSQPYTPPVPPPIPVEEPQPVYKAKIEKIRLSNDGFLNPGEDLRTTISLSNIGDKDLENARIAVVVPELGIWKKIGPFDLDEGDKVTREVVLDIPDDIEPGEYVARIVVSNGKTRRVVHRHIIIE
ncbi:PKD domain-containing protein, partial [Candidatus Woesearchaeota archaeon]|nr:PKD domain-containing protein [Candidatus Woesearchaeota archaeon]